MSDPPPTSCPVSAHGAGAVGVGANQGIIQTVYRNLGDRHSEGSTRTTSAMACTRHGRDLDEWNDRQAQCG